MLYTPCVCVCRSENDWKGKEIDTLQNMKKVRMSLILFIVASMLSRRKKQIYSMLETFFAAVILTSTRILRFYNLTIQVPCVCYEFEVPHWCVMALRFHVCV